MQSVKWITTIMEKEQSLAQSPVGTSSTIEFFNRLTRDPYLASEPGLISPSQSIFGGPLMAERGLGDLTQAQDMLFSSPCFALPRSLLDPSAIGPSLFNLLSPEGLKWIGEKVGHGVVDQSALLDQADRYHEDTMYIDPLASALRSTPFLPLPPKYVAVHLLESYFKTINPFCPLFDEDDFMTRFEEEYPVQPEISPAWWACINATLALACMIEDELSPNAWMYWKNCTLSLDGFFIQPPQLLSAQALLAMTLYLHGTFSAKPSDSLVSFAIRILHGLDFAEGQSQKSTDVYKRILTLCYIQDIDYSLRCGTPPARTLDLTFLDDLTNGNAPPNINENMTSFNVYSSVCGLTSIKTQVYHDLYSTIGSNKSDAEVIAAVGRLDSQLQHWKNNIPDEYRPESTNADRGIRQDPHLNVLYLHFSYYHCLLTIHRRGIASATWEMQLDPGGGQMASTNPRALRSRQLCVAAARASLDLVGYIPRDHVLCAG
ncbi:hypothetical protein FE257_004706 [Aspergillus nanangensis]|uniref:Xylanolytic transcriptional activator regulatory domain-containing protein n=1 Tax=Aspergillus nanangensis TaxID=2582783 RepID=A0AAD4GZH6_ASPNN|nr:hypothetical protein FE257_004706 [Aspergillus nanangensis]